MPANTRPKQWIATANFEHSGHRFDKGDDLPIDRYLNTRISLGFAAEKPRPPKATTPTEGE